MNVYVFLGPTLPREAARLELDAHFLPPVSRGCYRVARTHPFAIGVIDGNVERVPAVWHKEILWALSQRIHVFGGASMGALRAAELSTYGMRGIGGIYQDYQTGLLEDNDEVAVVHGDESTGYKVTSEAMVNIRATLRAAERAGAIRSDLRERLEGLAEVDGSIRAYIFCALGGCASQWCARNGDDGARCFRRVVARRCQARRCRGRASWMASVEAGEQAGHAEPGSAHTDSWEWLERSADVRPAPGSPVQPFQSLAAEVRLLGDRGDAILAGALARAAARRLQQYENVSTDGWAASVGDEAGGDFYRSEREVHGLRRRLHDDCLLQLENELRASGVDRDLMSRSREKEQTLARRGHGSPRCQDTGLEQSELLSWYFVEGLGRPVPADMPAALQRMGLPDVAALEVEAAREFLFRRFSGK